MKRLLLLAGVLCIAACGTSPEFVDEPEVASTPVETAPEPDRSNLPEVSPPPCGMSTRAVRTQARRGRYNGVEGFDSRTCPQAGGTDH